MRQELMEQEVKILVLVNGDILISGIEGNSRYR